ncbi:hypothetical protein [Acanthamoeba castellanii mimivirus]|uniref:Uncharacterized protein L582 n=5 Tax=Mimivirus TaxID=315393 RepID=YL582_MIMIV|nr:hypothetical protein MIMI_gp0625 [Acanthamoeba polyphaga mimivirus]Q5UR54.1 RecName: Full=Uncharacterized protein L582 [Acanthamoeba polyphaga mimivirus]AEQ60780.1 hypothetical protein [Acanthamoeba castellanii mamavirus]AHA45264.1 hypothetical protein HIRU_S358 [Hirudovirus strain Sangsue]AHJ40228.1 hypothetical protein [Samba virus]ALR84170.1 hypothetical protein [Niemeyer virus]AMZ03025.1 hypothetical protein [Mimivirus Bombay]EJN41006.1 hypothetical protein lvs_L503 [Acanthamoeba poly
MTSQVDDETTNNVNLEIQLTDKAREVLEEVFNLKSNSSLLNNVVEFITKYLTPTKLQQYVDEIRKILDILGKELDTGIELSFEILVSIKNIIEDFYGYLESIKFDLLSKTDRLFVSKHIDLIQQTVIVLAIDKLDESDFISKESLVKILSFVKSINNLTINMKVGRFIPFLKKLICCQC